MAYITPREAAAACPNRKQHTSHPDGYVAYFEWANARTAEEWTQQRCESCGLWVIWVTP